MREDPAFSSPAGALAWLDGERANLLAAQQAAWKLGLYALAWQFGDTLWGYVSNRTDYPTTQAVYELAADAAAACRDRTAEVFCAIRLVQSHVGRGDAEMAIPIADRALASARASGDYAAEASACEHRGICDAKLGRYADAIAHYERGLQCWRRATSYPRGEAIIHRQYGRALHGLGRPAEGNEHLKRAQDIFEELGETYHLFRTLLVEALYRPPAEAIALLDRARPLLESQDHPLATSELLTALARAHWQAGDTARARDLLAGADGIHQRIGLAGDHPARLDADELAGQLGPTP
jgi:tetratricopeptide (TPR) repeat protein